jgi:hypothetical protein
VVLLSDLLVRSAPGVPAMLLDIVEQGPSDGEWSLMRLRDDLEASLVPLNRAATRRVLARLLREVRRETDRSSSAPPPDARALDRELDVMLGVEPAPDDGAGVVESPGRVRSGAARARRRDRDDVTSDVDLDELADIDADADREADAAPAKARGRKGRAAAKAAAVARARSTPNAGGSLDEFEREASTGSGSGVRIGIGLSLLASVLIAGYVLLGRERSRDALGLGTRPESASSRPAAPPQPKVPARPRVGELRVTSTPERAQVLMLVGSGPVVVPKLPVGVAHEFLALAEGLSPSRAVVPADAPWQQEGGKQRYELALQLSDASAHGAKDDLGPTRLPQQPGAPKGPLGDVRVITSPPGAKVYQLIGFTPDVRVENLPVGQPVELLVYLGGYGLQRVVVGDADWKPQAGGALLAELDVKLTAKRK